MPNDLHKPNAAISAGELIRFLENFPQNAPVSFYQEGHTFRAPLHFSVAEMYGTDGPVVTFVPAEAARG